MKRLLNILGIVLTTLLVSAGVAAAGSLGLGTTTLGAGSVTVGGCTSSPLTATRDVDNNGDVTEVDVLNVPQACAGATLAVTLEDSSHSSLGAGQASVGACTDGCTVRVTGFGTVPAARVAGYALSLTG